MREAVEGYGEWQRAGCALLSRGGGDDVDVTVSSRRRGNRVRLADCYAHEKTPFDVDVT